jgi:hypothetical protein
VWGQGRCEGWEEPAAAAVAAAASTRCADLVCVQAFSDPASSLEKVGQQRRFGGGGDKSLQQ